MQQELYYEERIRGKSFYNLVLHISDNGILTTAPDTPIPDLDWIHTRSEVVLKLALELIRLDGKVVDEDEEDYFGIPDTLDSLDVMDEYLFEWGESTIGHAPMDLLYDAALLAKNKEIK